MNIGWPPAYTYEWGGVCFILLQGEMVQMRRVNLGEGELKRDVGFTR